MLLIESNIEQLCDYSAGGIQKLWFANYTDNFDLICNWNINDNNELSGFSQHVGFFEVDCERSIVNIEQVEEPFTNVYNKRLTISFSEHTSQSIDYVNTLTKGRFVIVYKDSNGHYFISGYDTGYMCLENIHRTETVNGRNAYGIVLTEQSRYPDRILGASAITSVDFVPQCGDYYDTIVSDNIPLSWIANCIIQDFD